MSEKRFGTEEDWLRGVAEKEARVDQGGGTARQLRQKRLGRMTARERILALCDAQSFVELGRYVIHQHAERDEALAANQHPGDGVIAGVGRVNGREVAVYGHDPTILRGALGHAGSKKVCRLLDLAGERRLPVIALADCDGVRVPEGTFAIEAYGEIIARTIALKGKVFQITLVSGLCVGAAAYTAALTDIVGMVRGQSFMFITGPEVTRVVTGENVTIESLGGSELHARVTGACHAVLSDENEGIAWVKRLLSYQAKPDSSSPVDTEKRATPELVDLIPQDQRRAYDMRKVVERICDHGSLLETSTEFGRGLLTFFARLGGRSVGIVASQPAAQAGCLDVETSRKGAWFVRLASALGYPIVTLVDVPGYLPGLAQEAGGIIPHGSLLLSAYGNARVPKVCLVVRKSFGGASVLSFAADYRLALPTAQIAAMGPDAAAYVAMGPARDSDPEHAAAREAYKREWAEKSCVVWTAAEEGYVDRVVSPSNARDSLLETLSILGPMAP